MIDSLSHYRQIAIDAVKELNEIKLQRRKPRINIIPVPSTSQKAMSVQDHRNALMAAALTQTSSVKEAYILAGVSRSTMYRYMKGLKNVHPTS